MHALMCCASLPGPVIYAHPVARWLALPGSDKPCRSLPTVPEHTDRDTNRDIEYHHPLSSYPAGHDCKRKTLPCTGPLERAPASSWWRSHALQP